MNGEMYLVSEWGDSIIKVMFLPSPTYEFNAAQTKFQVRGFR